MRKLPIILLALVVCGIVLTTFSGCQEEINTDTKNVRFIANENRKLKIQLAKQETELDKCLKGKTTIEEKYKNRMSDIKKTKSIANENKKLKDQLAKKEARIEGYARQLATPQEEYQSRMSDMAQAFVQMIQGLKEENAALQKQIEELKK